MNTLLASLRPTIVLLALFTLLLGVAYPLGMTQLATTLFPYQAGGSLIQNTDGKIVGSALIGQSFTDPRYFWGRPSATSPLPYNAAASVGSNLSIGNSALIDAVKARVDALRVADPDNDTAVPVDLVTASASGLDPDISPAAAYYQVKRVAAFRKVKHEDLEVLIKNNTLDRRFGFLGEPTVNVMALNRALDSLVSTPAKE